MDTLDYLLATTAGTAILIAMVVWSAVWKGVALYRAGSHRHKGWFIAIFLLNTLGILEILYLLIFQHRTSRASR